MHTSSDGRMTDTGPLTKKRMETFDEEVSAKAIDFMERAKKADKPFFLWLPRAVLDAMAGRHQARHRHQRDRGSGSSRPGRSRAASTSSV